MEIHSLIVQRTARIVTLGTLGPQTKSIWFVMHGYGQLAASFIRHFNGLDDGRTVVVAPEGLSRFYHDTQYQRMGASWMTKEDRQAEIADYLAYLNQVYDWVMDQLDEQAVFKVTLLGFSQGVSTAARWVTKGRPKFDRVIWWAGRLPDDIMEGTGWERLKAKPLYFLCGTEDSFLNPDQVKADLALWAARGLVMTFIPFEGRHEMRAELLEQFRTV